MRVLLVVLLMAVAAPAMAQEAKSKCLNTAPEEGDKQKTRYKVVKTRGGKTVYVLTDDFVICGKVPKPDVYYGLLNSTINYEWDNLKQDFMPRVLQTVEKSPF